MIPIFGSFEDVVPNLHPDHDTRKRLRERVDRLHTDPEYRARQRLRAQIGQSNGMIARGRRNAKVSLPKFSWDN
jgi:hypothetical protein